MEEIIIKLLEEADTQELLKFEIENRSFFKTMGFDRGIATTKLINLI